MMGKKGEKEAGSVEQYETKEMEPKIKKIKRDEDRWKMGQEKGESKYAKGK